MNVNNVLNDDLPTTLEECIEDVYKTFDEIDITLQHNFYFYHNASIVQGMSGGICVDAYDPSVLIGIQSHSVRITYTVHVSDENGDKIKNYTFPICNVASLVFELPREFIPNEIYSSNYFFQPTVDFVLDTIIHYLLRIYKVLSDAAAKLEL